MIPLQDLVRLELCSAIEAAVQADERWCLECMRLVDLLLVLLCEGRHAIQMLVKLLNFDFVSFK